MTSSVSFIVPSLSHLTPNPVPSVPTYQIVSSIPKSVTKTPKPTIVILTSSSSLLSSFIHLMSRSMSQDSKQRRQSVDNKTSSWETYIRKYRNNTTPTLSKLLFVVNYHWSKYETVSFLDTTFFPAYRKQFPFDFDVVITGPQSDQGNRVIGNKTPQGGHYSYWSLLMIYHQLCIVESCSYEGFVYMNDDSYVDPLFLAALDLSQSWIEPSEQINLSVRWIWYNKTNTAGVSFIDAYRNAIKNLQNTKMGKKCHFENDTNLRKGFADFYYITKKDMPIYYKLIPEMKRQKVFLEMAAPTVNWCITHNSVINCNHRAMKEIQKCLHVHPVKLRMDEMKEYAMKRLYHLNMDETPKREWYYVYL